MSKFSSTVLGFAVLLIMVSCGSTAKNVTISDLGHGMSKYEKNSKINVLQKDKVSYTVVGIAKYDDFFKSSAVYCGKVKVAQALIDNGKKNEARKMLLPLAVEGKQLISKGKNLAGSVKSDFVGSNVIKAPGVVSGITSASSNIKTSLQILPDLLKKSK